MDQRTTIKDVADKAKVSIATVSLVINGQKNRFAPETAQRVLDTIEKLKYRPNRIARSLQGRRSRTISFVTHKDYGLLTRSQWFSALLEGVLSIAVEHDFDVKLSPIAAENTAPERKLEDGSVDGVILAAPEENSPLLKWAAQESMPCVVAGRVSLDDPLPSAGIDDAAAEFTATQHLIGLGHRRIALLNGGWFQMSSKQRELGYEQAMREAGLDAPEEMRFRGFYVEASGEQLAQQVLKRNPLPTALVCASDEIAVGALRMLQQSGIRVPQDMSIVGFDDELKARLATPPISSVRQPVSEIGRSAASMLLDLIEDRPLQTRRAIFPTELILRGSTARPH